MQRTLALASAVLARAVLASFAIAGEARAQARVEVGILTCTARQHRPYRHVDQVPSLPFSAPGAG
jgi:hypothetical protein